MTRMALQLQEVASAMGIVQKKTLKSAGQVGGSGAVYAFQREKAHDRAQKRALTPVGFERKIDPIDELRSFVKENAPAPTDSDGRLSSKRGASKITGRIGALRKLAKKKPELVLPVPANNVKYTPSEAAKILAEAASVSQAIKKMVEMRYTDMCVSHLYAIKTAHLQGKVVHGVVGRPALASFPEVQAMLLEGAQGGNTLGKKEISLTLMGLETDRRAGAGVSAIGLGMSQKTLGRYKGAVAAMEGARVTSSAMDKSEARFTAERSLMNVLCQVHVLATTSFIPVAVGVGSKSKFASMVSKASGDVAVVAVNPMLLFSTDDTTIFAHVGEAGACEWRVAGSDESGKWSGVYNTEGKTFLPGTRVRLTFTLNGGGMVAPFFLTITGCSRREVAHESGMVVMKVPGLCMGADSDVRATFVGYIVFLCSDVVGGEQKNFEYYTNEVFLPWVKQLRIAFCDHTEGLPIPDELTAVSHLDGGGPQLKAITDPAQLELEAKLKLLRAKHSAAATAAGQPCDKGHQFRRLKQLEKLMGEATSPLSLALKTKLDQAFKAHADMVSLKPATQSALVDFAARLPQMCASAFTVSNVVNSFVETGLLDRATKTEPSIEGVLGTCRRPLTQLEEKLAYTSFQHLFGLMNQKGHITDDELEAVGATRDTNSKGEVVRREAGVSAENRQRAKVLSHEVQKDLRAGLISAKVATAAAKVDQESVKSNGILDENRVAEADILALLVAAGVPPPGEDPTPAEVLAAATAPMLAKLSAAKLKAIIHVRTYSSSTARGKWPNKGSPGMAEETLISMAAELLSKSAPNLLYAAAPAPAAAVAVPVPPLVIAVGPGSYGASVLPSELLRCSAWVLRALGALVGCCDTDGRLSSTSGGRADHLHKILLTRLKAHTALRIADEKKRSSWCLEWAELNVSPVAAIMVAFGHVKVDIAVATANTTLLASRDACFVQAVNEISKAEGCYLHKDSESGLWIRSGKVVGEARNFGIRNAEHARASQLLTAKDKASLFYVSYPSESSEVTTGMARRGYFGHLGLFVGIGFLRSDFEAVKVICSDDPTVGLLNWPKGALERIGAVKFAGCSTLEEKQLHMAGYLFELVYDLMISPTDNVSRSPGFETPLGIFGNTQ